MARNSRTNPLPTPINVDRLSHYLKDYDQQEKEFLISGFWDGFNIPSSKALDGTVPRNLKSATDLPSQVLEKINKEISLGRVAGPFSSHPFNNFVCSPIGKKKKKSPGTYRLIHHLSFPNHDSVNSNIPRSVTSVHYASVDQAARLVVDKGHGCYMGKTDIKDAFRLLPISPSCYPLLLMHFQGSYFYDKCLPMGLSISCNYFERFSSALEWVVRSSLQFSSIVHVLDDFFFVDSSPQSLSLLMQSFSGVCADLNVPLAPKMK